MKTNSKIQEKRQYLKDLSQPIQKLVKIGTYLSVNEGLKYTYASEGHTELKTVRQWNSEGKRVKKGEKALLLWGSPKKIERLNADTSQMDEKDYFPICFVFSQKQVTNSKKGGTQ